MNRTILSTLKAFLERCSRKALGYGLEVDFFKVGNSDRLIGLFNENGLYNMLGYLILMQWIASPHFLVPLLMHFVIWAVSPR